MTNLSLQVKKINCGSYEVQKDGIGKIHVQDRDLATLKLCYSLTSQKPTNT